MKIRAKASPSFEFEAHPDAAKELIDGGIYEAVPDKREPVKPLTTDTGPGVKAKPAKKGK